MLPVWVLDDMQFFPDVYAGMIPCIANGSAIHDQKDSCHPAHADGDGRGRARHVDDAWLSRLRWSVENQPVR
jgi:hypothetical protein